MNTSIWIAHQLVGDITISEIILRPDKVLTIEQGRLYSHTEGKKVDLGEFLGLAVDPMALSNFVKKGDEVVIIPASDGV